MKRTKVTFQQEKLTVSTELMRALAHPLRLKILEFLDQNKNIQVNQIYNTLKIEQSIARIDSGDYGYCDETGEAIGVGRLIARPTANLSLEAQQRRELKQKMFGD